MLGCLFGFICLFFLIKTVKRGRCGASHGGGCGHDGGGRRRGRFGEGFMLHRLFTHLRTSPDQESTIKDAVRELRREADGLRAEGRLSRDDIARAMRGDDFDEEVMGELFSRHDDAIRELRKSVVGALARIHDVLEDDQRARLGEMLSTRGWRWGGPYRGWA